MAVRTYLNITLVVHQGYIRHPVEGESVLQYYDPLFSALSETYIPLLKLFGRLEREQVPFACGMVFSPLWCALLSDELIQQRYLAWLDNEIAFGEYELAHLPSGDPVRPGAQACLDHFRQTRIAYLEDYCGDIPGAFNYFVQAGYIEPLASCATHAFLPHYADMAEVLSAQIELGLLSHKTFFKFTPEGFWLPHSGYTQGIEKKLREYGIHYTILDTNGLLFASPLPEKGLFSPARCENSLAVFGRDWGTPADIVSKEGFMRHPRYRNQNRDTIFERDTGDIALFFDPREGRIPSSYKYWANSGEFYSEEAARQQAQADAREFFRRKKERLLGAAQSLPSGEGELSLVSAMDARILGSKWHEGVWWLEELFRLTAGNSDGISWIHAEKLLDQQFTLQKITPYPCASSGVGYGENLLDNSNAYLLRYDRKAAARMANLAKRFSGEHGIRARMLNLAAKHVLLAESSDWPRMIQRHHSQNFAAQCFRENIAAFTTIFDSLASNTISTEWLTEMEKRYPLFPWMNYRAFIGKKSFENQLLFPPAPPPPASPPHRPVP